MKVIIPISILFGFILSISGCNLREVEGDCVLLKHNETGELGCFGCAGRLCKDPILNMKPTTDNSASCIATIDGCKLER